MTKQQKLVQLEEEIKHCSLCRKDTSGKIVFGEGDSNAKVMFVGEAPDTTSDFKYYKVC